MISSVNKGAIDLGIMDLKHRFDSEDLIICLNALHDEEIRDDMLALIGQANRTTNFTNKTSNGITEKLQFQISYYKEMSWPV